MLGRWQSRLRSLRTEARALWLAYQDPRVPRLAKLVAACVLAYALSPIDLVPDFIPVLGHLDDIILVPAGIALAFKLIPRDVLEECRERAASEAGSRPRLGWIGAIAVVVAWGAALVLVGWAVARGLARR